MISLIDTIKHILAQLKWNLLLQNETNILTLVKKLIIKIKILKFKNGDFVRISKYKNTFAKGSTLNWTYAINDLNREETVGTFYEKKLQKINQK